MGFLETIKKPSDLKQLKLKQLPSLAEEIRGEILSATKLNGGHLSANLGVVETTLAVHYAFDLPKDKLIFDVGHQCYAHKILSDRKESFMTIRQKGGLSGFPDSEESSYDAFTVGHAGTSIAAGIGYCEARDRLGEDYYVVDIVGDGAFVNGLNLEALTASDTKPKKFIIILNDNGMSISRNGNGLYKLISKGTIKNTYLKSKRAAKRLFGRVISGFLVKIRDFIKRIFSKNAYYFEKFGLKYVGVVDGNNINETVKTLLRVKNTAKYKAVLLHVRTKKGKGHEQSEERADLYHGVGKNLQNGSSGFSATLGEKLNEEIEKNGKIVAITAGMKDGTGLKAVEEKFPRNFFDVGIAESYAVTLAAGMAIGGLRPVVAVYSTFMQRAYDQILHDVCLQSLPVIFCLDRAGFVGEDGKTHQGLFDLSFLSHMPNMTILAPNDEHELKDALDYALTLNSPVAIRYPKCGKKGESTDGVQKSPWLRLKEGDGCTLIAVGGRMKKLALDVADKTEGTAVVSARLVKPLDYDTLASIKTKLVVTLEENSVIGGFGAEVARYFASRGDGVKVITLGAQDAFVKHGTVEEQLEEAGLKESNVIEIIKTNRL